jgi:hypothetical protein
MHPALPLETGVTETHVHSDYLIGYHHTLFKVNSGKVLNYIKMSKTST